MRISDWSSDVCSSDLERLRFGACRGGTDLPDCAPSRHAPIRMRLNKHIRDTGFCSRREADRLIGEGRVTVNGQRARIGAEVRSEEHTSELQSLMRISYAAFCFKTKNMHTNILRYSPACAYR